MVSVRPQPEVRLPYSKRNLCWLYQVRTLSNIPQTDRSKPDPEVFLKAAEFLGLKPEECGVVEDAYAGIDAAVSGHMTSIAIGDAAGYDKADYKLSAFRDLLDIAK